MKLKRNILLNPGPATTTDTVKMAQVVPDICPREREFTNIMDEIRRDLVRIVHGSQEEYKSVLFCGSGTICIDVCLNSLLPEGKKILILNNGSYSQRAAEICECYHLPFLNLEFPYDQVPDLGEIEQVLKMNPDIFLVHTTHHETGTGLLNPVGDIGRLVHQYHGIFSVDTTSSFAMRPLYIEEEEIDICMSSAQKGLMAMTGLSFLVGKRSLIEQSKEYPTRSYYNNLYLQYEAFEKTGEMRFTPPVQTIYALQAGIKEYFEEGEEAKWERHQSIYKVLQEGMCAMGFQELLDRKVQAQLVCTFKYPENPQWDFIKVHDYCYERGFTIYPGKAGREKTFRLCAFGAITVADIQEFLSVFRKALSDTGISVPVRYPV